MDGGPLETASLALGPLIAVGVLPLLTFAVAVAVIAGLHSAVLPHRDWGGRSARCPTTRTSRS
ncbi:MAG: hypothetical protein KatS3mg118_3092 [Paracoccaceae bacterium]|nr:MAG: hypothetical protein KatS3mg118_3092 [Paracoccaceae bacterium]